MDDESKKVIENTLQGRKDYGYCYGGFHIPLSKSDIDALLNNKCIAATVNCGEYSVFIHLQED